MKLKQPNRRFAAMLLFQHRVMVDGVPRKRRLCEKRIITYRAMDGPKALKEAKRRGRTAQFSYLNAYGNRVHFEFIGVQGLLCLDSMCEADEVWYEFLELLTPMERRRELIPPESKLHAIFNKE